MPEHCPEPWRMCDEEYETRAEIAYGPVRKNKDNPEWDASTRVLALKVLPTKADARRIVACVNACRHLPIEFLEEWADGLDSLGLALAQQHIPPRTLESPEYVVEVKYRPVEEPADA